MKGQPSMDYDDKMYKVKHDLETLVEAGKIHMDKARYKAAMKYAEEERKALGYGYEKGGGGKMKDDDYKM